MLCELHQANAPVHRVAAEATLLDGDLFRLTHGLGVSGVDKRYLHGVLPHERGRQCAVGVADCPALALLAGLGRYV